MSLNSDGGEILEQPRKPGSNIALAGDGGTKQLAWVRCSSRGDALFKYTVA